VEEKILYLATQRWRGGVSLPIAAKPRLNYGGLVTPLVPPTPAMIAALRGTLAAHNALEAGLGGLYETHERLAGAEAEGLLPQLRAAQATAALGSGSPHAVQVRRRGLGRAGYHIEVSDGKRDGRPRLWSTGLLTRELLKIKIKLQPAAVVFWKSVFSR
jgi:hypothetical protein